MGLGEDIAKILRNQKCPYDDPYKEIYNFNSFEAEERLRKISPDLLKNVLKVGNMIEHSGKSHNGSTNWEGEKAHDQLNKVSPRLGDDVIKIAIEVKYEGSDLSDSTTRWESHKAMDRINQQFPSNEKKNSGGCYLTSACINSMDLTDNCFELQTLRYFRDEILLKDSTGKKSVLQYYDEAPEIVNTINNYASSNYVWKLIYEDIIIAVKLVVTKEHYMAFTHYKHLMKKLKDYFI